MGRVSSNRAQIVPWAYLASSLRFPARLGATGKVGRRSQGASDDVAAVPMGNLVSKPTVVGRTRNHV